MSTKLKHQRDQAPSGANTPSKCQADDCGKMSELMNYCPEHYAWLKWGLLTKEGKRPSDFDKKYQAYKKSKAA